MCGITGFIHSIDRVGPDPASLCRAMADTIAHRGPDAGGVWVDPNGRVALGHRRLSIIDLSEYGAQPMVSASGRYVLSFNGEIYNFRRLRQSAELSEYPFRGHSDSEVILAAAEYLGVEAAIERLQGMFAVALWDRRERCLWLARDRAGKKPLYYGWCAGSFMFGSELKALRRHPDFDTTLDHDALGQYLQYGWVSAPLSIYAGIRKLPAGNLLRIPLDGTAKSDTPSPYWTAREIAEHGAHHPFTGSYDAAIDALDEMLNAAVADRMVADVELGALLSGGIDSSTIVGMMQRHADRPVKTFSIGFQEKDCNEAEYAASVARHLGTEHYEMYVTPQNSLDLVEQLPDLYDEPFADPSQIPTYLVSQLARQQVKVVLTGDGGDETLAGYSRYRHCLRHWQQVQRLPVPARAATAIGADALSHFGWWAARGRVMSGQKAWRWTRTLGKIRRRANNWRATSAQEILSNKFNHCLAVDHFVSHAQASATPLTDRALWADVPDPMLAMQHYDYTGYLADDILVKVDRASMAVGLEARAPLLDQRVLAFAWSLPQEYLFDGETGKKPLRDLLSRYVPRKLTDRPKRGFHVPIEEWLIGPLHDWAEELISDRVLRDQGVFNAQRVREMWLQHQSGWTNHSQPLWSLLMFQAWWQANGT